MLTSALIVVHVILVMTGYAGLIATNVWLLALCRAGDATTVRSAVDTWPRIARIFGPMLGIGVLTGFALAAIMGFPLTALWLVITYALIVVALATQGGLMARWQSRAAVIIAQGGMLSTRPVALVVTALSVTYVALAALMILRPV